MRLQRDRKQERPVADIILTFTAEQVASVNNINKTGTNETTIDVRKTFADVTESGGVAFVEVTVSDTETRVNSTTGETNFLEKTQGDANTTITSMRIVMNDGTVYVLKDGSPVDFREQDTSDTPNSFTPSMGDSFVETNSSVQLVNDATGQDAPTSGSGSFADLANQNLVFSNTDGWSTGTQTRQIDSSGDTGDSSGDGLFNICFARGTRILTDRGEVPVEELRPGDLVETRDHGLQPVRWVRSHEQPLEEAAVDARPVEIKAGALGHGSPARRLIVSPQHRILVGSRGQLDTIFAQEAFAPAKSLTGMPGIRFMKGKNRITWRHFALDRHEVVTANGCHTESLLLGPMVLNGLTDAERREVFDVFGAAPVHAAALNGPPARRCLAVCRINNLIAEHCPEHSKASA